MNKQEIISRIQHQGRIRFDDIRPGDSILWFRAGQAIISEVQRVVGRLNPYWVNTRGNPVNPEGREFYLMDRPTPDLKVLPIYSSIRFKNHMGVAAVGMKDSQGNWNIIDENGQRYHGTSHEIMKCNPLFLEVLN